MKNYRPQGRFFSKQPSLSVNEKIYIAKIGLNITADII